MAEKDLQLEMEEDNAESLQTIDLGEAYQTPVLSFQQQEKSDLVQNGESEPVVASTPPETPPATSPQLVEGTELQRRARTSSTGSNLKEWGMQQLKISRQVLSERFGKGLRTVDVELEKRLGILKDTQRKYNHLISLASQFETHFQNVVETQKSLAEHFAFLSVRNPELSTEFTFNSEAQKKIARNGETLISSVKFFISNIRTVATKSIEDTIETSKNYETSRVLYDAYRTELEALQRNANANPNAAAKYANAKAEFEKHKKRFETLRQDLDIKLKLLDENKVPLSYPSSLPAHSTQNSLTYSLPLPCSLTHSFLLFLLCPLFLCSSCIIMQVPFGYCGKLAISFP